MGTRTGGGSSIGGGVETGKDFTGRDSSNIIQYFNEKEGKESPNDLLMLALFGDTRLKIPGLINDIALIQQSISSLNKELESVKATQLEDKHNRDLIIEDVKDLREILGKYTDIYESFDTRVIKKFNSVYVYLVIFLVIISSTLTIASYLSGIF